MALSKAKLVFAPPPMLPNVKDALTSLKGDNPVQVKLTGELRNQGFDQYRGNGS